MLKINKERKQEKIKPKKSEVEVSIKTKETQSKKSIQY